MCAGFDRQGLWRLAFHVNSAQDRPQSGVNWIMGLRYNLELSPPPILQSNIRQCPVSQVTSKTFAILPGRKLHRIAVPSGE